MNAGIPAAARTYQMRRNIMYPPGRFCHVLYRHLALEAWYGEKQWKFCAVENPPTNYLVSVSFKQLPHLFVTVTQAAVVFLTGHLAVPFDGTPG